MAPGGMFPVAPDYVIPLPEYNNNKKRKGDHDRDIVPKKRYRDDIPDPAVQVGGGGYKCKTCGKRYARKWTMERHKLTHQDSSDRSESSGSDEEEGDDENEEEYGSEEENEESEEEEEESLSPSNIRCLLHMVGAAELGKIDLKTEALRVFVTVDEKCGDKEDDNDHKPPDVGPVAIRFLKELLIAAQYNEIFLTKSLYSSILDGIDKAVGLESESEEEEDEE